LRGLSLIFQDPFQRARERLTPLEFHGLVHWVDRDICHPSSEGINCAWCSSDHGVWEQATPAPKLAMGFP
jgi:hypothetical protein